MLVTEGEIKQKLIQDLKAIGWGEELTDKWWHHGLYIDLENGRITYRFTDIFDLYDDPSDAYNFKIFDVIDLLNGEYYFEDYEDYLLFEVLKKYGFKFKGEEIDENDKVAIFKYENE